MTPRKKSWDVFLVVVCSLTMVVAGLSAYYSQQQDSRRADAQRRSDAARTDCLNKFANQMADALDARTQATGSRDRAAAQIFRVVFQIRQGDATQADLDEALAVYVKADDTLIRQRAENPYPDPPREVCPSG